MMPQTTRILPALILLTSLGFAQISWAATLPFSLHKLESGVPGPTVLVIGGIQGDEPGGFHAASLLVTDYQAVKGYIWVVPNLNFASIIRRSRGINGDMNRKFHQVSPDDPDYSQVQRIKALIADPQVDFIFNLHDGSGFYRPTHINKNFGPKRWGQSIIIDQERVESPRFGELDQLSQRVAAQVNEHLLKPEHRYHIHNTFTRQGDEEMAKTLTYFAINRGKPAVGIEASKSLGKTKRVYYHLQVMEAFLEQLGVEIERDFPLQPTALKQRIETNLQLAIEDHLLLDISRARKQINYLPLEREATAPLQSNNPLVAVTPNRHGLRVNYGNRRVTVLKPQFFDYDTSLEHLPIAIDGTQHQVPLGSMIEVEREFRVTPMDGYRVNVIGWTRRGIRDEAGHRITQGNIAKRFSIDRSGTTFRIEVYRGDKFSGMVLVRYTAPRRRATNRTG